MVVMSACELIKKGFFILTRNGVWGRNQGAYFGIGSVSRASFFLFSCVLQNSNLLSDTNWEVFGGFWRLAGKSGRNGRWFSVVLCFSLFTCVFLPRVCYLRLSFVCVCVLGIIIFPRRITGTCTHPIWRLQLGSCLF